MGYEAENQRIYYLQMIQASIDRMATTSAIFKGFCATIITGISAISFTDISKWLLVLAICPVACFLIVDIYYLRLEKRFRVLYDWVRTGNHKVDFDLTPPKQKLLSRGEASLWNCIKSPSIYLFYVPSILISIAVIIMKFVEVQ